MDDITDQAATTKQRMTNVEFVTELMEFSRCGAMAQIFIIDAIRKHAEAVATVDPETIQHPLISGHAWVACAREIKARMQAHYDAPIVGSRKD